MKKVPLDEDRRTQTTTAVACVSPPRLEGSTALPSDSDMLDFLSNLGEHSLLPLTSGIWVLERHGDTMGAGYGVRGAIQAAMKAGVADPIEYVRSDDAFAA